MLDFSSYRSAFCGDPSAGGDQLHGFLYGASDPGFQRQIQGPDAKN
jgi:hypothetical protein